MRFGDTLIPAKCQGCGRIFPDGATFLWAGTGPICGDCAAPSASPPSSCPTCSRAEDLAGAAQPALELLREVRQHGIRDAGPAGEKRWLDVIVPLAAALQSYREAATRSEERCPLCAADITHDREDAPVVLDLLYEVRGRLGERDAEALGFLGRAIEMLRERLDAQAAPRDEEREALRELERWARQRRAFPLVAEGNMDDALARLDAVRAARG